MYSWCYYGFTLHADALNWFYRLAPAQPATVPAAPDPARAQRAKNNA
jgi:hypothetical protein